MTVIVSPLASLTFTTRPQRISHQFRYVQLSSHSNRRYMWYLWFHKFYGILNPKCSTFLYFLQLRYESRTQGCVISGWSVMSTIMALPIVLHTKAIWTAHVAALFSTNPKNWSSDTFKTATHGTSSLQYRQRIPHLLNCEHYCTVLDCMSISLNCCQRHQYNCLLLPEPTSHLDSAFFIGQCGSSEDRTKTRPRASFSEGQIGGLNTFVSALIRDT